MTEVVAEKSETDAKIPLYLLLEKGLVVLDKITSQSINVNKEDMINLINFEVAVRHVINGEKTAVERLNYPPHQ